MINLRSLLVSFLGDYYSEHLSPVTFRRLFSGDYFSGIIHRLNLPGFDSLKKRLFDGEISVLDFSLLKPPKGFLLLSFSVDFVLLSEPTNS
jgi:hypothetical protein